MLIKGLVIYHKDILARVRFLVDNMCKVNKKHPDTRSHLIPPHAERLTLSLLAILFN
ncbi:hypothetical protein ES15_2023 [Cronobacter sakazakii ES15]|nr:hypothetical protein ES15_2023 [Cronobacter sakazakii ES15]